MSVTILIYYKNRVSSEQMILFLRRNQKQDLLATVQVFITKTKMDLYKYNCHTQNKWDTIKTITACETLQRFKWYRNDAVHGEKFFIKLYIAFLTYTAQPFALVKQWIFKTADQLYLNGYYSENSSHGSMFTNTIPMHYWKIPWHIPEAGLNTPCFCWLTYTTCKGTSFRSYVTREKLPESSHKVFKQTIRWSRSIPLQMQNTAFPPSEVLRFLPAQVPLKGSTAIWCTRYSSQFCAVCDTVKSKSGYH